MLRQLATKILPRSWTDPDMKFYRDFTKAVSRASGVKVARIEDIFGGMLFKDGLPMFSVANFESYLKVGSKKVWATWKCCDVKGHVLADTKMILTRKGGDGKPVKQRDIEALMSAPNPFESWTDMLYKWEFHYDLTGNAFWAKDGGSIMDGSRPKALFSLNPKRIQLQVDRNNGQLIGYLYKMGGMDIPFDKEEVIHWKRPHPDNDFWGLGEVEAGEGLFNEFINRDAWSQKFWKNGAAPSGILICEEPGTSDETEWEKLKKKWQKDYGGSENSGKTAWLSGKWKYEQLGMSVQEMQQLENSKWNIEAICHQHGVPLSIIGLREASNYATAEIEDLSFRRYTIKPRANKFAETFTTDLIAGWDANLQLTPVVSGLTSVTQVVTAYGPLFDRGAVSLNELRELAGLPRMADAQFDQHFINAGLIPLELAGISAQDTTGDAAKTIIRRFLEGNIAPADTGRKALPPAA
jgi:HK97 family phage portal protein